ncbi:hypothetical protein ACFU6N_31670, partial [Streptomyces sp. NPDC057496]
EKLTSYLIPTVIIAGITWIISLLNPASAFVRAVKGIIDIVTFIVNQGAQIIEFVNAVLDSVIAIANGGSAGVPKMVETALAASVPLLIGFLASLLGIGNLANKVKSVFHAVAKPVNRAIDKIVDLITKKGKAIWNKLKGKDKNGKDGKGGMGNDKKPGSDKGDESKGLGPVGKNLSWTVHTESHRLWINLAGRKYVPMIASKPHPVEAAISSYRVQVNELDAAEAATVTPKIDKAAGDLNSLQSTLTEYETRSKSGAARAVLDRLQDSIATAQEELRGSVAEVQKLLGHDSDERLKKAKDNFKSSPFTTRALGEFLAVSKRTAERSVNAWIEKGAVFRVQSHEVDPLGKNTFDPAVAAWRETSPNNRHKYGYVNPSKTSAAGLEILTKGLLGKPGPSNSHIKATPSEEKDPAYHQQHARYESVVNPPKYPDFPFPEAILGHAPPGASGHWNRIGHTKTREENRAWNQMPSSYHGPEHEDESAASGSSAERYELPTKERGSHESWWESS